MADQKLTVVVGADVTQLEKGVAKAESSLKKFQKTSANTGVTLTNLGRIASDAPFGFIAIQNNLDPLIQSFGQLKAESGSTGKALKSLFASLAGPAGIALGFSLVASAATTLIQKYGSIGNAIEALTNATNKEFQARRQILEIQKEATKSAGEEVARLKVLTSLAADTTQSYEFRARAVQTLQKEFGPYLKNVTEEALLNGNAAKATNEAANAILNKALALAAEKKLGVIGGALLDNQLAQIDAAKRLERANSNLSEQARKSAGKEIQGREGVNLSLESYRTETTKVSNEVKRLAEEGIKAQAEFDKVLNLSTAFAKKAGAAFFGNAPKAAIPKVAKEKQDPVLLPIIPDPVSVTNFTATADRLINDQFARSTPVNIPVVPTIPAAALEQFKKFADAQKKALDDKLWNEKLAQMENFAMTVGQNLSTLFLNIAANGGNAFQTIADTLKNVVKSLAAAVIKAAAFAAIMAIINPASAGKGGVGFFKGFLGALGLGGSQIGGPNFAGVGGNSLGNVQFRLNGSDLVGSIQRTQGRINRVG